MSDQASSQRLRILKYLKEHGQATTADFLKMRISRFSARLYELRKDDWIIRSEFVRHGSYRYVFLGRKEDQQ